METRRNSEIKKAVLSVAVITAIALTASAEQKIVIDGSTTVGPIAKAFAEYFMVAHPDVNITVSESGSGNGTKALVNNTGVPPDERLRIQGRRR
jgi:phosphate transport system substrate-binding protein